MKFLFYILKIVILLFLIFDSVFSKNAYKEIKYYNNKIEVTMTIKDTLFNYGDTISIKYEFKNNTNNNIFIFDPNRYYCDATKIPKWTSEYCQYEIDLGGSWLYDLDYFPGIQLVKIEEHSKFDFTFNFILKEKSRKIKCSQGLAYWEISDNFFVNFIIFDIGYIIDSSQFKSIDPNSDGYIESFSRENAIFFETNLNRLILGPAVIKLKEESDK